MYYPIAVVNKFINGKRERATVLICVRAATRTSDRFSTVQITVQHICTVIWKVFAAAGQQKVSIINKAPLKCLRKPKRVGGGGGKHDGRCVVLG